MHFSVVSSVLAGLAAAAILSFSAPASAETTVSDAIGLCRTTVAQQAGVEVEHARFDQVRVRPRAFLVDIDLWSNGHLTNVRCEVPKAAPLAIASITPALTTATAQR